MSCSHRSNAGALCIQQGTGVHCNAARALGQGRGHFDFAELYSYSSTFETKPVHEEQQASPQHLFFFSFLLFFFLLLQADVKIVLLSAFLHLQRGKHLKGILNHIQEGCTEGWGKFSYHTSEPRVPHSPPRGGSFCLDFSALTFFFSSVMTPGIISYQQLCVCGFKGLS